MPQTAGTGAYIIMQDPKVQGRNREGGKGEREGGREGGKGKGREGGRGGKGEREGGGGGGGREGGKGREGGRGGGKGREGGRGGKGEREGVPTPPHINPGGLEVVPISVGHCTQRHDHLNVLGLHLSQPHRGGEHGELG